MTQPGTSGAPSDTPAETKGPPGSVEVFEEMAVGGAWEARDRTT